MRIWDKIHPTQLCRKHLLGEHLELHCIWSIITKGTKGYSSHPEVKRWVGKLPALKERHTLLVDEMTKRGWNHKTPLPACRHGKTTQDIELYYPNEQIESLKKKKCLCKI